MPSTRSTVFALLLLLACAGAASAQDDPAARDAAETAVLASSIPAGGPDPVNASTPGVIPIWPTRGPQL